MHNTEESTIDQVIQEQDSELWVQEPLIPTILSEDEPAYESVRDLQQAMETEGVLNIALTGPYGSGKSSVLGTLMSISKESWNFLPISLAH